ncbi:MAG: electron transfer flavoprotein subunit beta/FixA family protein [Alphaproteobacteria bacterium]|nr:electron transfer flavoprotein subunit beta/FixA family protein [Alphaproteobacteria bacterium]
MKIGVLLKQVPASDSRIKIADPQRGVALDDVKWEINPYDEFALEAALALLDAKVASDVVLLTVGGADTEQRIRDGLARGATAAVRLDDAAFGGSDCLGVSRILAAAVKAEGITLVFAGKQAIDGDNAQVPAMVAELLGWGYVGEVDQLEVTGAGAKAWRAAGGGARDVVEVGLPAVIGCDKGLNQPRYASLKGIMMAKRKKIDVKGAGAIGVDAGSVGASAALVSETNWGEPPARPPGRVLQGDDAARVKALVAALRDEVKVI